MEECILTSIKKLLGIADEDTSFDEDIKIHINTVFSILNQIGVGPSSGFRITDDETWNSFMNDALVFESVKTYVYLRVKLIFDPPLTASVMDSINNTLKELEFRLNVSAENKKEDTQNE